MNEDLKIAWRNLWRNKRRTVITASSVFFAVFFAILMRSYELGSYDNMIMNFIGSYSGYLQVQHSKYQDNPSIDYSFNYSDSLEKAVSGVKKVVSVSPHIESFALASSGTRTKGVAILAIDPVKEKSFSDPENKLVKYRITRESVDLLRKRGKIQEDVLAKLSALSGNSYSSVARLNLELGFNDEDNEKYMEEITKCLKTENGFLSNNDEGILVSDRLAGYLKVAIGDTVILIGQGYHGSSAEGVFPVRGIIKMPSPDIDNKLVIMTLPVAGKFFDAPGKITSLSVNLTGKSDRVMRRAKLSINSLLTDKNTVTKTWEELNPVLVQQIQGDSQTGIATLAMLYFIIFFGIFGTVLMMIAERTKEFGVLISIGMQRKKLKNIVFIEMILLGAIGLIAGMIASIPFIMYFFYYPIVLKGEMGKLIEDYGWDAIMPTAWFGPYFYKQAIIVFIMVLLATLYPIRKIGRLKETEALKS
jgi:ABC-type lipoprotein release transport system permease subunit